MVNSTDQQGFGQQDCKCWKYVLGATLGEGGRAVKLYAMLRVSVKLKDIDTESQRILPQAIAFSFCELRSLNGETA